jgi:glycosyltransferase involved in cell wall biosynthesis
LVTFALFTYNQEAYVAEAVEGALAQDYHPLEIIISDDASTDRTFDIIRVMIDRYRGPHPIRLIRNDVNLGIGAHVTRVANMARGELIVAAAGDDVSMPGRSSAMARLWERLSRAPDLLCCDIERIDRHGQSLGFDRSLRHGSATAIQVARYGRCALGATATWSKRLWIDAPELPSNCEVEDQVLTFRAALRGGVARHPEPLVRYRMRWRTGERSRSGHDPASLSERLIWLVRTNQVIPTQIEDALRYGRPDLVRYLEQRARKLAFMERIHRRSGWPSLSEWRGIIGFREAREAAGAVVATRFPWAWTLRQRAKSMRVRCLGVPPDS